MREERAGHHLSLLPVIALLLCGCAAANQDFNFAVTRIDAGTIRLTARSAVFANGYVLRNAALLRAAEETLRYNRRTFIVVEPELVSRTQRFWAIDWRPRWQITDPIGPGDILIRMMSGAREVKSPPNVFDALAIIETQEKQKSSD